jgi:hypothetical protein
MPISAAIEKKVQTLERSKRKDKQSRGRKRTFPDLSRSTVFERSRGSHGRGSDSGPGEASGGRETAHQRPECAGRVAGGHSFV